MHGNGVGVVACQAQSCGSVADKAAHLFHNPPRNFSLPHVVQQPCWYDPVKGPRHVEQKQRSHCVLVLPRCMDMLNQEVEGSVYGPAGVGSHVLGREEAMLLRQRRNLSCYNTLQHLPKHVKEGNGSPGSRDRVVSFAWLSQGNGVAMAESNGMIRVINASLKEGLKKRYKWASKKLQNEKGDAITACCFERVQLFNDTGNLLLRN